MHHRSLHRSSLVVATALLALTAAACTDGGDAEVLGAVQTEGQETPTIRTGTETETETGTETETEAEPEPEPTETDTGGGGTQNGGGDGASGDGTGGGGDDGGSDVPTEDPEEQPTVEETEFVTRRPDPGPDPVILAAMTGESGLTWHVSSDGSSWLETSSAVLTREDEPKLRTDLPSIANLKAAERDAVCSTTLAAPKKRPLDARGTVEVWLEIDGVRIPRLEIPLDVELEAGEVLELPDTGAYTVSREDVEIVSCGVRYRPAD